MRKGISPLIAAVLLVAFTMAIAGIMAAWATQFSTNKLGPSDCALALAIIDKDFSGSTLTVALANRNDKLNLTDIKATVVYPNLTAKTYTLRLFGADDPLGPLSSTTAVISMPSTAKPKSIELVAGNCLNAPFKEAF